MKLVAIDMDGTLLTDNNIISQTQIDFFSKLNLSKENLKLVISTGRPIDGVLNLIPRELWSKFYIIALNGSVITNEFQEIIHKNVIEATDMGIIINFIEDNNIDFALLDSKNFYGVKDCITRTMHMDATLNKMEFVEKSNTEISNIPEICKVLLFVEPEQREEVFDSIPTLIKDNYSIIKSQPYLIEILKSGTNKGSAINYLANYFNNDIEKIAIGDGLNDIDLFKSCDFKIAMKNSVEEILLLADMVTEDNNNDGVIKAIRNYVLERG